MKEIGKRGKNMRKDKSKGDHNNLYPNVDIYTHSHRHTTYINTNTHAHIHIIYYSSQIVLFNNMFESL